MGGAAPPTRSRTPPFHGPPPAWSAEAAGSGEDADGGIPQLDASLGDRTMEEEGVRLKHRRYLLLAVGRDEEECSRFVSARVGACGLQSGVHQPAQESAVSGAVPVQERRITDIGVVDCEEAHGIAD